MEDFSGMFRMSIRVPFQDTELQIIVLNGQRAKRSKSDAQELAHRAHDVLYQVCSSIDMENPSDLPAHLREEIQRFEQLSFTFQFLILKFLTVRNLGLCKRFPARLN